MEGLWVTAASIPHSCAPDDGDLHTALAQPGHSTWHGHTMVKGASVEEHEPKDRKGLESAAQLSGAV